MADNASVVIGIELLAACQGIDFHAPLKSSDALEAAHKHLRAAVPTLEVGVVEAAPRDVPLSFEYAGRTAASRAVEVRARVSGTLLEQPYAEAQRVSAGKEIGRPQV